MGTLGQSGSNWLRMIKMHCLFLAGMIAHMEFLLLSTPSFLEQGPIKKSFDNDGS